MTPDHVCLRIYNYGKDTEFFKIDWTQVFKHMRTVNFSFFSFGGRLFYESQMTFGARSSPDWCNVPRSIPLEMALMEMYLLFQLLFHFDP